MSEHTAENDALIDEALAEIGRESRAAEACPICHASVRPDRRDRHINWHASLAREVDRERLPQVFGAGSAMQSTRVIPPGSSLAPLTTEEDS